MIRTDQLKHVVWIQTSFIGDIVLTTGAMALLKSRLPSIQQHVITTGLGVQVLQDLSFVDSSMVLVKKKGRIGGFKQIKQQLEQRTAGSLHVLTIQPHRSLRSSLLARFLNYKTITYEETVGGFLAAIQVPRLAVFHESVRIAMLLTPLGVRREEIMAVSPVLEISSEPSSAALSNLFSECSEKKIIAIAPGSVWGTKRWIPQYFRRLIEKLLKVAENRVILLGSPEEAALASEIGDSVNCNVGLYNLAGQTTLQELNYIFPRINLLVANDSSPTHFASAHNCPVITLFGATVPEMGFGPQRSNSRALGVPLDCRPCSDHGPQTCPLGHFQCMNSLSVDSVFVECKSILDQSRVFDSKRM